jgi:hypothetical protein
MRTPGYWGSYPVFSRYSLELPPTSFSHFWIASAASEARDITIYFKAEAGVFKISGVLLVEKVNRSRAGPACFLWMPKRVI